MVSLNTPLKKKRHSALWKKCSLHLHFAKP
nr:MAG TPA: hypothetical protein [Caudoviricetes sp.]